jgi:hypothetical protein
VRLLHRAATALLALLGLLVVLPAASHAAPAPATLSAALSAPASPVGAAVAVSGAVTPGAPGQVVTLQRYRPGRGTAWPASGRTPQVPTGSSSRRTRRAGGATG